jgi:hypothetical protein
MGFGASPPKTPQQAARFETPGSPEYEAAVAKGLDMSQAGRMARAKEMGFDTDTVLYHGTQDAFDALIPSENGAYGPGIDVAIEPRTASGYATSANDLPTARQWQTTQTSFLSIPKKANTLRLTN